MSIFNNSSSVKIRLASKKDAAKIRKIYEPYVLNTAITFEYDVPSIQEFNIRIKNTLKKYPYLVAEDDTDIIGYCYASQFRSRIAYCHGAELSVYIRQDFRHKGIGKLLYTELEKLLRNQNVFILYAAISATERKDDDYLTDQSLRFHKKEGFTETARHEKCGCKFGKWYDIVWMEKRISEIIDNPPPFIPFKKSDYVL